MSISTKKGDSGYTSLLRGQRVPKYHVATEAVGTLDEANSHLGLARAVSNDKRIKRIILQVQKHIFIISAELSVPKGHGSPPKKKITEADLNWLERLIENFEEALALPPGFVAFGQEISSSYMDVARTSIRKAERTIVRMKDEDMIENIYILKYINRISDLFFVLAGFEEKDENERRRLSRSFLNEFPIPLFRKWIAITGLIITAFSAAIILILIFHNPASNNLQDPIIGHSEEMQLMHDKAN